MSDHEHQPQPDQLPRAWADGVWERYVAATGTNPDTRTYTMYREDLAWYWEREIVPLQNRVEALEATVAALAAGSGGLVLPADVRITEIP
jgi:hypothetical protein